MANNIPTQQVPSVEAQPAKAQGWNLDTRGAFGAGTADGLRDLRQGVADLSAGFKRAKAEADVSAVQNAETQLDRHINQRVYTGGVAYLSKRGEEAIVDFEDADQSLDREKQRLSESLANDEQRAAFERRAGAILSGTRRQMGGHLAKQVEFTKDVRDQAQIQETLRLAASPAYADEAEAKRIVGLQHDYDRATAARKGLPRPAVESLMRSTEAAVHETRVKSAIDLGDYSAAGGILKAHGELLEPAKRDHYQRTVDKAMDLVAVEQEKSAIVGEAKKAGYDWLDPDYAAARVEGLPTATPRDVERKKDVASGVWRELQANDRARAARAERMLNEGLIVLDGNGKNLNDPALGKVDAYFADPENGHADAWLAVKGRIKREREARWRANSESGAEARRRQAEIDAIAHSTYLEIANGSLEDASSLDLESRFGAASDKMRAKLGALQAKDKKKVEGGGVVAWDDAKAMAWDEVKGLYAKKKDKAAEFSKWFRHWYDSRPNPGEPPTRSEVREALGKGLTLGDSEGGSWTSRNKLAWEAKAGEPWKPLPIEEQESDLARRVMEGKADKRSSGLLDAFRRMLPSDAPAADQLEPLAPLTPVTKADVARAAKAEVIASIRKAHPEWTIEQKQAELTRRLSNLK